MRCACAQSHSTGAGCRQASTHAVCVDALVAVLVRQWGQVGSVAQQCIADTSVSGRRTVLALVEVVGVTFFFVGVFVGTF